MKKRATLSDTPVSFSKLQIDYGCRMIAATASTTKSHLSYELRQAFIHANLGRDISCPWQCTLCALLGPFVFKSPV